ncbi:MAG TPA: rhodanese-like domain-containing protein [Edaphocola sp.]|nr:rhodanese-like domain-containing protein [Edaphocola sp.]
MGIFSMLFGKGKKNEEVVNVIKNGAFLVDVRTSAEFSGGSVKGAINIPLNQVQSQLSKFKAKKGVVVFCASGNRSAQAKRILEGNGIQNVYNGGSWSKVNRLVNS